MHSTDIVACFAENFIILCNNLDSVKSYCKTNMSDYVLGL